MTYIQPIATPAGVFTHENIQRVATLIDDLYDSHICAQELTTNPGDTLQVLAQSIAWFCKDLELETNFFPCKFERLDEIDTDEIKKLYKKARRSLDVLNSRIARYNDPKDDAGNEFLQEPKREAITMCTISEINLFIPRMVTIGRFLNVDFWMLLEQELNK